VLSVHQNTLRISVDNQTTEIDISAQVFQRVFKDGTNGTYFSHPIVKSEKELGNLSGLLHDIRFYSKDINEILPAIFRSKPSFPQGISLKYKRLDQKNRITRKCSP
jgi:hypothetical protein